MSSNCSYAIARCHFKGIGTEKNYIKGFQALEASANEGDQFGQHFLASSLQDGNFGIQNNDEKAFYWEKKAAEQGLSISQKNVGLMYGEGRGCEENKEKAIIWFKKASNQGCEESRKILEEEKRGFWRFLYGKD